MTTQARIEYWPAEATAAEQAALRWLKGYRHGTVTRAALTAYYEHHGAGFAAAAAAGRMWRKLVGKLFVDPERQALTPVGIERAGR